MLTCPVAAYTVLANGDTVVVRGPDNVDRFGTVFEGRNIPVLWIPESVCPAGTMIVRVTPERLNIAVQDRPVEPNQQWQRALTAAVAYGRRTHRKWSRADYEVLALASHRELHTIVVDTGQGTSATVAA